MEIKVVQAKGKVPVTILKLSGALDGSTYMDLVNKAIEVYDAGARDILIDMSGVNHMGSAGLVALQTVAKLVRGEGRPQGELGWDAVHDVARNADGDFQPHLKLLGLTPTVDKVMDIAGVKDYFYVFSDESEAVASF